MTLGITMAPNLKTAQWRLWQKVLAYATLIGVSLLAVWYVDLKIHTSPPIGGLVQSVRQ
jgi:hypothetical protein